MRIEGFLYLSSTNDRFVENSRGQIMGVFKSHAEAEQFIAEKNSECEAAFVRRCLSGEEPVGFESETQAKTAFEGGATRSAMKERFDLIPREAVAAMARRLALGAERHGENNWRTGGAEFRKATISHLMKHLLAYMENGNEDDANTDAIICNAAFLCFFEARDAFTPGIHR